MLLLNEMRQIAVNILFNAETQLHSCQYNLNKSSLATFVCGKQMKVMAE